MSNPSGFTDEILSDEMAAILRSKTPTERLAMCLRSWTFLRDLIRRTAQRQHPDWTEQQLDCHVFAKDVPWNRLSFSKSW